MTVSKKDFMDMGYRMKKYLIVICSTVFLQACFFSEEYELKKYYKDPMSAAAQLMGGTYAGVVATFNTKEACLEMKREVEADDARIGYTNSRFVCDVK